MQITSLGKYPKGENIGFLHGDHYTMCRFQTPEDAGFLAVSRRLKLMSSGEKEESIHPKPEDPKKGKGAISDMNYSSQSQLRCGLHSN